MGTLRGQWSDIPYIEPSEMTKYNAFLLGIPTRYGNMPAQWKVGFLIQFPVDIDRLIILQGILGQDRRALERRLARRQVCRGLLFDLDARRRTRDDCVDHDVDACASRNGLRASWILSDFRFARKLV